MPSLTSFLISSSLLALARAHGVVINAQGEAGSPASIGFQVEPDIARNCTTINPCQQDATIIRDAEIKANVVNQCGRTELTGNIDVGENTENAIAANQVTQVKAGGEVTVTIHQVNADGAGPYFCDLDESSNTGTISHNLTVTDNVPGTNGLSQAKAQAFNITVKMPDDMNCFGASTGNICTVRCRNNALAGPFGGCFAVEQTDTDQKTNSPATIQTAQKLGAILDQVQIDQADFPTAVKANQDAGTEGAEQNRKAVEALLGTPVTSAFPQETPDIVTDRQPVATASPTTGPVFADPADLDDGNQGNDNNGNNNNNNDNNDNNDNNNDNGNTNGNDNTDNANNGNTGNNNNGNDNTDTTDDTNNGNTDTNNGNGNGNGNGRGRGRGGFGRFGGQKAKRASSALRWAKRQAHTQVIPQGVDVHDKRAAA